MQVRTRGYNCTPKYKKLIQYFLIVYIGALCSSCPFLIVALYCSEFDSLQQTFFILLFLFFLFMTTTFLFLYPTFSFLLCILLFIVLIMFMFEYFFIYVLTFSFLLVSYFDIRIVYNTLIILYLLFHLF